MDETGVAKEVELPTDCRRRRLQLGWLRPAEWWSFLDTVQVSYLIMLP